MHSHVPVFSKRKNTGHHGNILLEYVLTIVFVILFISVALGVILTFEVRDYQIRSHIQIFPEILRVFFDDEPELRAYLLESGGKPPNQALSARLGSLLRLGGVFRAKLWEPDGTIRWSDQPELIGKRYIQNREFTKVLAGQTVYEIGKPDKEENIYEHDKASVLEIYVPVRVGGMVTHIIELYEENGLLEDAIRRNTAIIWSIVGSSGAVLYTLLFALFNGAYKAQKSDSIRIKQTQDVTIYALALQAELRDASTGHHLERTGAYVRILAEELAKNPEFSPYLVPEYIADLTRSAPLHDVGKTGVPDAILRKPGRLDEEEMTEMRRHCEYGATLLRKAEASLEFRSFLSIAIQVAAHHHERWDGTGYPAGLSGTAIPLSARIMTLADSYDAMRTKRSYKEPYQHERCIEIIREESGKQFDPAIVAAFLSRQADFAAVAASNGD